MKITAFNPLILSSKADDAVQVFAALGFEKTHAPINRTETGEVPSVRMKNADGFHVDVANVESIPRDATFIRMNVDNFAEAYDILIAHGFKNTRGDGVLESKHAKSTTLIAPSGFAISLVEHIKK